MSLDHLRPTPQRHVALVAEVQALGRLMDSMDRGAAPVSARQYRRAAVRMSDLLATHEDLTLLRHVCVTSSALRELLQNELTARAQKSGTMRWLYPLKF